MLLGKLPFLLYSLIMLYFQAKKKKTQVNGRSTVYGILLVFGLFVRFMKFY